MIFRSNSSLSCRRNSSNSMEAIRYEGKKIGFMSGNKSMVNSMALAGGTPGNSPGKTSAKSATTGGSSLASAVSEVSYHIPAKTEFSSYGERVQRLSPSKMRV